MPKWIHRTTKHLLSSVPSADLPESATNYIEEPDLSAVQGWPPRYWSIVGNTVTLMSQTERDAVDATLLSTSRDEVASQLDRVEDVLRAFALILLDELNAHTDKINAILTAIDTGNNLSQVKSNIEAIPDYPQRTVNQLKTGLRNKLGT